MRQRIKKYISLILAATLAISTLSTSNIVYADGEVQDDAQNGGEMDSEKPKEYTSYKAKKPVGANDQTQQGYLMYLVDENLVRVTPLYYFVKDERLINMDKDYIMKYTRFDNGASSEVLNSKVEVNSFSRLKEVIESGGYNFNGKDIPTAITTNGTWNAQGKEFRNWMIDGIWNSSGNPYSSNNGPGIYIPPSNPGENESIEDIEDYLNSQKNNLNTLDDCLRVYNSTSLSMDKLQTLLSKYEYRDDTVGFCREVAFQVQQIQRILDREIVKYKVTGIDYYKCLEMSINNLISQGKIKLGNSDPVDIYRSSYLIQKLYNVYNNESEKDRLGFGEEKENNIGDYNPIKEIPLANGTGYMPAYILLGGVEGVDQLIDTKYTKDKNGQPYINGAYALQGGCLLIVEPLLYTKHRLSTDMSEAGTYEADYYSSNKFLHTYYTLCQNWSYGTNGGNYGNQIDEAFANALTVGAGYTTLSGKTIYGVTEAKRYCNVDSGKYGPGGKQLMEPDSFGNYKGCGMHAYNAGDLGPTDSSTHTWDKQNNPSTEAKAPTPPTTPDSTKVGNIVKIVKAYYEKENGVETPKGVYTEDLNPHTITIEDEPTVGKGYTVVEWRTSTVKDTKHNKSDNGALEEWTDVLEQQTGGKTGASAETVVLDETEKTLYVKLVSTKNSITTITVNGDYILEESEIAKAFSTKGIIDILPTFDLGSASLSCSHSCNGHTRTNYCSGGCDGYGGCPGHDEDYTCSSAGCSGLGLTSDKELSVKYKNEEEKEAILNIGVFAGKFISETDINRDIFRMNKTMVGSEQVSLIDTPEYLFTAYRKTDNITVCKYNQRKTSGTDSSKLTTSNKMDYANEIKSIDSNYKISNNSNKTRQLTSFVLPLKFKFVKQDNDNKVSVAFSTAGSCDNRSSDRTCSGNSTISIDSDAIEAEADLAVKVYIGQSLSTDRSIEQIISGSHGEKFTKLSVSRRITLNGMNAIDNMNNTAGLMLQSLNGQSIKFYPFVRMTYTKTDDIKNDARKATEKTPVNILSEFERELVPNDYAEVAWNYQGDTVKNLKLLSNMWATDKRLTSGGEWRGNNQVLKGGANFELKIDTPEQRKINLRTYQVVFPDNEITGAEKFITNGDNLTDNKATVEHQKFVDEAKDSLEKLHIVQRVSTSYVDKNGNLSNEQKVERGEGISFLDNGSNSASSDSKYYLSKDLSGTSNKASEGDLDILAENTSKQYYKVWSDIAGNIYLTSGNSIGALQNTSDGTKILNKNDTDTNSLNGVAKSLNDRTYVVDKLIKAIERNSGNDTTAEWVTDGHWYNESFAMYIVVNDTELTIGFKNTEVRVGIIDPKLIPKMENKADQGTKAFSSQFTTDNYSEKYGLSNKGQISTFKSKPIYIKDMNKLYTSQIFYIPNMTVQDNR